MQVDWRLASMEDELENMAEGACHSGCIPSLHMPLPLLHALPSKTSSCLVCTYRKECPGTQQQAHICTCVFTGQLRGKDITGLTLLMSDRYIRGINWAPPDKTTRWITHHNDACSEDEAQPHVQLMHPRASSLLDVGLACTQEQEEAHQDEASTVPGAETYD